MQLMLQRERAEQFHKLHAGDKPLLLVNAWDAASARLFEQAGSPAIATTSAGLAWSLGYPDGEQLKTRDLIQSCERICRVVTTPVSVDIERGFGRTLAEISETVRSLLELGVVGVNIEDGVASGTSELVTPAILADKISAIRAVADNVGIRLFINARTDTYFVPADDPIARYDETVRRAQIYIEAGADGIFVPGLEEIEEIARMTRDVARPLNIYAGYAGLPPVAALGRAGVRRVSLGCGPFQAALALVQRIATEVIKEGTYTTMTASMLSAGEVNNLFSKV
jgi:2-methylisocitrate lyase-like PEP mutase family enzyme